MDQEKNCNKNQVNLQELFLLLKRNVFLILGLSLLFGAAGFGIASFLMTPVYEAEAKMIVNTKKDDTTGITSDQIISAKNLVDTYSIILRSRTVLIPVIEKLDLSMSYEELQKMVTVTSVDDTQVMEIAVRDPDPALAKSIADEILNISPQIVMDSVEAGSVKTIENAYLPEKAVAPEKGRITILSALLGFSFSLVLVMFRFWSDHTYKSEQEIVQDLGIPVLGVIPSTQSLEKAEQKRRKGDRKL